MRRVVQLLAGRWTGLALLAAVFVYLAAASMASMTPPASPLEAGPGRAYAAWPFKALLGLLVLNILLATLVHFRPHVSQLGAWLSHAGVLVLAGGAIWYGTFCQKGHALAIRDEAGNYLPIDRFFRAGTTALYVATARLPEAGQTAAPLPAGQETETPLSIPRRQWVVPPSSIGWLAIVGTVVPTAANAWPSIAQRLLLESQWLASYFLPGGAEAVPLNVPTASPLEGLKATVLEYLPRTSVGWEWRDDGPADAPAVELLLEEPGGRIRALVCGAYAFARQFNLGPYVIQYAGGDRSPASQPSPLPARREIAESGPGRDVVEVRAEPPGAATLSPLSGEGAGEPRRVEVGGQATFTLAGRQVKLTLLRVLSRAWRAGVSVNQPGRPAGPAVKLDVSLDGWRGQQWIGYESFARPIDPTDRQQQMLLLPGGGMAAFFFAPRSGPLPRSLVVESPSFEPYPGTVLAKDYVSPLAVLDENGRVVSRQECRLNHPARVGPFRVFQGKWLGEPDSPTEIIFEVNTSPGVWAVWAGCVLMCAGMAFAFYVKPALLRRRGAA